MRIAGLLIAVALVGCTASNNTGSGTDAGTTTQHKKQLVEFTGHVVYDPAELQWRGLPVTWASEGPCANGHPATYTAPDAGPVNPSPLPYFGKGATNGAPPCLDGDTFNIEDGIRALEGLSALKSVPLTWNGAFDVPEVDVSNTTLGIVGSVKDPSFTTSAASPTALAFSGFGLGKPPFNDGADPTNTNPVNTKTLPVYILSVPFLTQVATAIGSTFDDMTNTGVVLVHVVDSDGLSPVAGAVLAHVYSSGANQSITPVTNGTTEVDQGKIYYLNDDLTGVTPDGKTSKSGLIARLNVGSASSYTATLTGSTFEVHLNGSRPGTGLELFIRRCPINAGVPGISECQ